MSLSLQPFFAFLFSPSSRQMATIETIPSDEEDDKAVHTKRWKVALLPFFGGLDNNEVV